MVDPWLETLGVVLVAVTGAVLGRAFSRFRSPFWALGFFLSCLLFASLVLARCNNSIAFLPPFCWLAAGRVKFIILALAVTIGLTTPLSRLPRKFEQYIVCVLMSIVVAWFCVLPFLVPALLKDRLSNLRTRLDSSGICYQSTAYTCAPAAAVTALRKLGLPAQEGELAVLSHTSPVAGTLPGCLETALQNRYASEGLRCQYRYFDSIGQLRDSGVTLAVVRDRFLSDHCVAVLEVSDRMVTIADPVVGRMLMSHEQFERIWRFTGIVLKRPTQSI
ncbi:MAG: cysteine peptidase family C39 domain-containing protein [Planctomycetota bacterium]